ncbi:MAG: hypothetical protein Q9164_002809 [Protoblastenia rupestris]
MSEFNEKNLAFFTAMLENTTGDIKPLIDWDKVATLSGYKDAHMAKLTFTRLQKSHESLKPKSDAATSQAEESAATAAAPTAAPLKKRKAKGDTPAKSKDADGNETPVKKRSRPAAQKSQSKKDFNTQDQREVEENIKREEDCELNGSVVCR